MDHIINMTPDHNRTKDCTCDICTHERSLGCLVSYNCRNIARRILDAINKKWNSLHTPHIAVKDLTPDQIAKNVKAINNKKGDIIFDPTMTLYKPKENGFQLLGDKRLPSPVCATQQRHPNENLGQQEEKLIVITCGKHKVN